MNQQIKQRLIGAVVLVSAAVIFIPMLLEGHRGGGGTAGHGGIPGEPKQGFKTIEIPLEVPKVAPDSTSMVDSGSASATPKIIEPAAKPKPVTASVDTQTKPVTQAPAKTVATVPSKPAPTPPTKPAPQQPAAAEPVEAWAVQVGSFGSQDNALSLRDKLRKDGFDAYVEKVATGSSTVFRVRVGPELRRDKADALRERLQKKDGVKGIVVRHHDS